MIKIYIKKCDTCGIQYIGQTVQNICEQSIKYPNNDGYYEGSGKNWKMHNKVHKTHRTKILFKSSDRLEIENYCKVFSKSNPKYWETDLFANMIEEDGKETNIGSMASHPRWEGGKSYNRFPNFLEQKIQEIDNGSLIKYLEKEIEWQIGDKPFGKLRTKKVIVEDDSKEYKVFDSIERYIDYAEKRMLDGYDDASLSSGYREYGPKNLRLLEELVKRIPQIHVEELF